ncbi:hypothetical protein DVH26_26930 [Paenibacillus sp. H1-7]|nr:hypothetical protein DVH26_26930 [Paenibacillus sp. H1-7]
MGCTNPDAGLAVRNSRRLHFYIHPVKKDDHAHLIRTQQKRRGWKGFILPVPNCTVTGIAITLRRFSSASDAGKGAVLLAESLLDRGYN